MGNQKENVLCCVTFPVHPNECLQDFCGVIAFNPPTAKVNANGAVVCKGRASITHGKILFNRKVIIDRWLPIR